MEGNTLKEALKENTDLVEDRWTTRIRIGIVLLAFLWLVVIGASWSHADDSSGDVSRVNASQSDSGDNYSFRWLDPDKKIYVLQNRRYTKSDRAMLSFLAGPGFSNPYRNTFSVEPRLAYYFSEQFGIEGFYQKTFNMQNNTYNALIETGTKIYPIIHEVQSQAGALLQWVPWYAKINFFNNILYFDWYLEGGLGSVNTAYSNSTSDVTDFTSQNELGLYAGTGQLFHLGDTVTVRLDFMGTYYRAPLMGATGDNVWFANYDFTLGFGVRL